ncbi:MAG: hypothetical protein Q8O46_05660 [bacterium]|nr:hypothetical protein [bacterium]
MPSDKLGSQGTPEEIKKAEEVLSDRKKEGLASWQREIEIRDTDKETRELLHKSNLKLEVNSEHIPNKGESKIYTITGRIEGKNVLLVRRTVPRFGGDFPVASRDFLHGVPESRGEDARSINDIYSGEVDGKPVDSREAERLWDLYSRVASVATVDQELSDYVYDPKKKPYRS